MNCKDTILCNISLLEASVKAFNPITESNGTLNKFTGTSDYTSMSNPLSPDPTEEAKVSTSHLRLMRFVRNVYNIIYYVIWSECETDIRSSYLLNTTAHIL